MSDGNFTNTIPRDHNDRPQIFPAPGRGKTHADVIAQFNKRKKNPPSYRRTTKFIGVLEDSYNLDMWALRMVARGVAERDDLIDQARSIEDIDSRDGKDLLNLVANRAKSQMRTGLKANLGSYLHYCTDLKDRHGDNAELPSPAEWAETQSKPVDIQDGDYSLEERDADIDAYLECKLRYGLRYNTIEQMRVYDPWKIAGTPDRTGTGTDERFGAKWMVLDVKTGSIDWDNSQREIAMQFAMYAHSTPYSHEDGRGVDVPAIDRTKAITIHLPVMEAKCELHFVDITAGWDGCIRAQTVWDWRSKKGIFTKLDDWEPANHLEKLALKPSYVNKAMTCTTKDELRELWVAASNHIGALNADFKAAVQKRLQQLESAA